MPLSSAAPVGDANLGQYRAPLQRVAIAKMLHQLSQVRAAAHGCRTVSALQSDQRADQVIGIFDRRADQIDM